jgi:hypothetical protein
MGVEVAPCILNLGSGLKWVVRSDSRLCRFTPKQTVPVTYCIEGWVGNNRAYLGEERYLLTLSAIESRSPCGSLGAKPTQKSFKYLLIFQEQKARCLVNNSKRVKCGEQLVAKPRPMLNWADSDTSPHDGAISSNNVAPDTCIHLFNCFHVVSWYTKNGLDSASAPWRAMHPAALWEASVTSAP